ncbi:MAG: hypothetical protein QM572_08845 [Nocardioides sp.]|uniref:hypothetical protein n=1 Tax=Nocardioides sp. TaxID=35761 RepID=UPI0039E3A1F4
MDVLLIDDKEGEGALLVREWEEAGIRVLHSDDLDDLAVMLDGGRPDGWPDGPYEIEAAVIDLDLGGKKLGLKTLGAAGGIVATDRLFRWRQRSGKNFPIALRTADVIDDRALAAVLAAEIAGRPLPLWGKSSVAAQRLRAFVLDSLDDVVQEAAYGAVMVHPVRFVKGERGENLLGDYLYDGKRADVWRKLWDGWEVEPAILAAGYRSHNKFWETHQWLIATILHLRDQGRGLHELNGERLRLPDYEEQIWAETIGDLDQAIYDVAKQDDLADSTKRVILASLRKDLSEIEMFLAGKNLKRRKNGNLVNTRPSQKRNVEQGEFLGVYGQVLGHPEVVKLFRH